MIANNNTICLFNLQISTAKKFDLREQRIGLFCIFAP